MFQDFGWPKDFFTEICIAPEEPTATDGYRKPSPKFEFEMIDKFDLDPQQCWVVGDKWIDPQTGLNASMRGALVKTGKPITAEWHKQAESEEVPIYKDVAEFAEKEMLLNV
jgi:histidinol phosphatase-like enzyme